MTSSSLIKGEVERKTFPDGEKYLRILSNVEDQDVVIVGGTESDSSTMDLFDLACTLVSCRARKITLLLPYFGYSTMERTVKEGEGVTAKHRALLLSSIPSPRHGLTIVMLDLHSEGIPYYFEGGIHTHHVYAKPVIEEMVKEVAKGQDFILASTDAGRAKWVASLAKDFNVDSAFIYKRRSSGSSTEVTGINADVKGREVIIYDDMIRTGSSLLGAAKAYLESGATGVSVIATHGVFPPGAIDRILDSGLIKSLSVTNSHPRSFLDKRVRVFSIKDLLKKYI